MIYILAVLLPPLGLLLNGQPFSAIFSVILIVFSLIFGILFFAPVLFLLPSIHGVARRVHEAGGQEASGDR